MVQPQALCTNWARKNHISKNKDRDIPYKPPYNEAQGFRGLGFRGFRGLGVRV